MPSQHRSCDTCTYFEADRNRDQGECRRHAPKHGTSTPHWPRISKYSWCGEYAWHDTRSDVGHDEQSAADADAYAASPTTDDVVTFYTRR